MENTTRFDLEKAIQLWREKLSGSPAFCADNLDELEAHLRSSVERLQATGLPVDEAFTMARQNLGGLAALEKEYGKINARPALFTSLRLLVGLMAVQMVFPVASISSQLLVLLGLRLGLGFNFIRTAAMMVEWSFALAFVWFAWQLARRNRKWLSAHIFKNKKRQMLTAGGLLTVMFFLTGFNLELGQRILMQKGKIIVASGRLTEMYAMFAQGEFVRVRWFGVSLLEIFLAPVIVLLLASLARVIGKTNPKLWKTQSLLN